MEDAYNRMLSKKYFYLDGNQRKIINGSENRPSIRQFRYHLSKNYSFESRAKNLDGEKTTR